MFLSAYLTLRLNVKRLTDSLAPRSVIWRMLPAIVRISIPLMVATDELVVLHSITGKSSQERK